MANQPDKPPRTIHPGVIRLKAVNFPPGQRPKGTTMAKLEAKAAFRRRLLYAGVILSTLIAGILIGRFLLH